MGYCMTRFLHVIHLLKKVSVCWLFPNTNPIGFWLWFRIVGSLLTPCFVAWILSDCGSFRWKEEWSRGRCRCLDSQIWGREVEDEIRNRHRIAAVVDFCISCFFFLKVIFNFYHGKSFPTTLSKSRVFDEHLGFQLAKTVFCCSTGNSFILSLVCFLITRSQINGTGLNIK